MYYKLEFLNFFCICDKVFRKFKIQYSYMKKVINEKGNFKAKYCKAFSYLIQLDFHHILLHKCNILIRVVIYP